MTQAGSVAIIGCGVNNRPLVPYFLSRGRRVVVADRRPPGVLEAELAAWRGKDLTILGGADYLDRLVEPRGLQTAYVTPGMIKHLPQLRQMAAQGVTLTCETDLFLSQSPAAVLGVTGSAGKTTTTTLIGEILRRSGIATVVGGNIGRSLLPELDRLSPSGWAVTELSSFQLDLVRHSPRGAVWLNLSPNHLDIHGTYAAYAAAKRHILEFQDVVQDWVVMPADSQAVSDAAGGFGGRRYLFSLDHPVSAGAYVASGKIWWQPAEATPVAIMGVDDVRLPGRHNLHNVLAATAASLLAGAESGAVAAVARTFAGVPHRLERVAEVEGVTFINDSIATAPDRTSAALDATAGPIVLIAGGYDKHLDYAELGRKIAAAPVRAVVLVGQTAEKIARALREAEARCSVTLAGDFDQAVELAYRAARPGDTVLLSPAAASYDMFTNFEERGRRFQEIVGRL